MAKVAVLVPSQELCNLAQPLVGTFPSITLMTLEYIKTSQAESRARELERQGCDLIVARGVQARIIKQSVKLPVVEISVTLQELASVMLELKSELALPCPRIGLIGVANMFSDTSRFNELFGIELKLYMVRQNEELANAVSQAQADGCVGVIGGDIVCETARQKKLAYKYIPTGSESVHNALNFASRVGYAIDLEKHNSAEINALLNYTFNGIIQVDSSGVIRRVNRIGYSLLGQASSTLLGCSIYDALPNLNRTMLEDALLRGKEAYSFLLDINHKGVVVNIAPILVDSQIEGAVLTFQEGQRLIDMDSEMRRELYQRGFVARYNFDNIICDDPETQALFELAKRISKFSAPILLTGETGSGKNLLAQCIHNESLLRKNAFVTIDCSAWLPETLDNMLFGNYTVRKDSSVDSYAEMAQDGTLYLSHVEMLPLETQYKLLCLIRGRFLHNGPSRPVAANVRIIASSTVSLIARVEKGEFRSDLYYALSVLSLEMLPLRRHRGDILGWTAFYLDEWQEKYKRYVHLTQGAQRYLQEYEWPGNLAQLNSVCERLVLLTVLSVGNNIYRGEPEVAVYEDASGRLLLGGDRARLDGFVHSATPQTTAAAALNYSTASQWGFTLEGMYAGRRYVTVNPLRRTDRFLYLASSPEERQACFRQERLPDAWVLNVGVTKGFTLFGVRVFASLSVDNLLDRRDIVYGGYEQMRFDEYTAADGRNAYRPFPARYSYAYPRTFLASLTVSF